MSATPRLDLYRSTSHAASAPVIRRYSTSFGMATALFPKRARGPVTDIYALVRVADEIVDGTAGEAGLDTAAQRTVLDELEADTERAMATGFSANLVVQAFADTARANGIDASLTRPFFAAMRRDLDPVDFADDAELQQYVHGSAEVIGLMCLCIFVTGTGVARTPELDASAAALGSAFQKINFLRDLADDATRLERQYLPCFRTMEPEQAKRHLVAQIQDEIDVARAGIRTLPRDCRLAVATATALFGDLLTRIESTPAAELMHTRISVPTSRKFALVVRERIRLAGAR